MYITGTPFPTGFLNSNYKREEAASLSNSLCKSQNLQILKKPRWGKMSTARKIQSVLRMPYPYCTTSNSYKQYIILHTLPFYTFTYIYLEIYFELSLSRQQCKLVAYYKQQNKTFTKYTGYMSIKQVFKLIGLCTCTYLSNACTRTKCQLQRAQQKTMNLNKDGNEYEDTKYFE